VDAQGNDCSVGKWQLSIPEDSAQRLGTVEWKATGQGRHELRAEVTDQSGHEISNNIFEFEVAE
jgi:hypothetical protein